MNTTQPKKSKKEPKKRKSKSKYLFRIDGIDVININNLYGVSIACNIPSNSHAIPQNTTDLNNLAASEQITPDKITYFDESKRLRTCSIINPVTKTWCWWCKHPFSTVSVALPIEYNPAIISKTYKSVISKSNHVLKENAASYDSVDDTLHIDRHIGSYVTDGTFCSFNCALAFCNENLHKSMYNKSKYMLTKLYKDFNPDPSASLPPPAPSWRLLVRFGGYVSIDSFRNDFSKIEYVDRGFTRSTVLYNPLNKAFEEKLKF
jgi:hypothetical protein